MNMDQIWVLFKTFVFLFMIRPSTSLATKTPKERVMGLLDRVPLIDGHNDMAWKLRKHIKDQLEKINLDDNSMVEKFQGHTTIPLLRKGKVGGQFWSAYMHCISQEKTAIRDFMQQIDVIKRFVDEYDDIFTFVTTADGIIKAHNGGKIAALIGVEGGHAIDSSMAVLRMFYELGARYMTLTHFCNNPWVTNDGLTVFGKDIIKEMNRLGMLIDLSHVPHKARLDVLQFTKAPVMFSHSTIFAVCNDSTAIRDDTLQKVKKNGGVIMVNFISKILNCGLNKTDNTTIENVINHIEYIKRKIGIEHVGIGSDFDGIRKLPEGLENVSKFPDLFIALAEKGYSDEELEKIAGLNLIRAFKRTEDVAKELRAQKVKPNEKLLTVDEFMIEVVNNTCRVGLLETIKTAV